MTSTENDRMQRRVEREKRARLEAEKLLEEKSLSLYEANQRLELAHTEQKQAAEDLKAVLDNIPRGILITDASGVVDTVNFVAIEMFDTSQDEASGRNIKDFLPDLASASNSEHDPAVVGPGDVQISGVRKDQTEFPVELAFTTVGEEEKQRIVWMVRDITKRIEAERERKRLEEELRQAQKLESLGTLAGGIAHELNTPIQFVTDNMNFMSESVTDLLDAIKALGDLAPKEKKEEVCDKFDIEYIEEEAPQAIEQSIEGLKRIADIVLAVKKFSHPSSSGKEKNDLNDIIQTTAMVSKNQWKYVADLDLQLGENIPAVYSNAGELNQVFLNLIVNAAHAIEDKQDDGAIGNIKIETSSAGEFVECRISDDGTGIPENVVTKVFDPFFTTKDPGRGTGQGLSIVHSIVTQSHNGEISVESEIGKGTTFVIRIPIELREGA
jgi:two-component system NtrC family sensor kinase